MGRMLLLEEENHNLVEGFCMVKSCSQRTDSKGGSYLDMVLSDRGGECAAKLWNYSLGAHGYYEPEDVVKVRASINLWKDSEQLKVERIRKATAADDVDMSRLVPCAPIEPQESYDYLYGLAAGFADGELKALVCTVLEDNREKLLRLPAALKLHHATRSGWLQHTCGIVRLGRFIASQYPQLDEELIVAGAILHDIGKLYEFDLGKTGLATAYSVSGQLLGHIQIGMDMIAQTGDRLNIRPETVMLLQHMLLSHHGQPEFGSPKYPMFPEAEVLSLCDLLDSRLYEMEDALSVVAKGGFSERQWALDNRMLYKHGRK